MNKTIHEIIECGEDSSVEFKSEGFRNENLAREVAAFSNMSGGSVFIGVEDDGSVTGVSSEGLEERVINICRNLVEPSVIPELHKHVIDSGKKVLELFVPRGAFKPYKVKSANRFYVRVGSVSIEPSNQELARLLQSGGVYHYEVTSLPGTSLRDIDILRFRKYCEEYRKIEFDETTAPQYLTNWQLTDSQGQCSVVGCLFFGTNKKKLLPQAGIQLFRFEGIDKTGNIIDPHGVGRVNSRMC